MSLPIGGDNMKLLVTYHYGTAVFEKMSKLGYDVTYKPEKSICDDDLAGIDILVCYDPFKQLSEKAYQNLSHIILSSTGINQLPQAVIDNSAIKITHNRFGYNKPIAEWIIMMLLVGFKQLPQLFEQHRQKQWRIDTDVLELSGKRIVFLGTGNIAAEAVKRLQPFDVEIIGVNRSGNQPDGFDEVYQMAQLQQVLPTADAVVVCLPQTAETKDLIDANHLQRIKDDAVFINIARGWSVDEKALCQVLEAGKFKFCALDVVKDEPLEAANPLWNYQQVLITPHNSWVSENRNQRRLNYILENLKRINSGSALLYQVNAKRGY